MARRVYPVDTSAMIETPKVPVSRLTAWAKALGWQHISVLIMSQYASLSEKDLESDLIPELSEEYQLGYKLGVLVANMSEYKVVRDAVDLTFDYHKRDLWFWFGVADGVLYFYSDSYKS